MINHYLIVSPSLTKIFIDSETKVGVCKLKKKHFEKRMISMMIMIVVGVWTQRVNFEIEMMFIMIMMVIMI